MTGTLKIKRALVSLFDKSQIGAVADLAKRFNIELIASAGTAKALAAAGADVQQVEALTGWPEMLGGRVKTLHPKIHGGILARRGHKQDEADIARHQIQPVDLVILGLYPFEDGLRRGLGTEDQLELIDIGAPAMLRGAAKNHAFVAVLASEAEIPALVEEMAAQDGATRLAFRRALAGKAFARTAAYDAAIADWLAAGELLPERLVLAGEKITELRYGENPHQIAALYQTGTGLAAARPLQGKPLSFNNLTDAEAARALVREFSHPAAAIIKHANPCGVAEGESALAAWEKALAADPISAFGGIAAFNVPLDGAAAKRLAEIFLELVIAPEITKEAREVLAAKKNLRLLEVPFDGAAGRDIRFLEGGFLVQSPDSEPLPEPDWRVASRRQPDAQEREQLLFAWRVARHVKSNAIILASGGASLGIGAGQMSRVDAARLAVEKAGDMAAGAVAASDAFFPFADGLELLANAGVRAVVQPGGSMRDPEVITAADAADMAMIFTGQRHFRH